MATKKKGILTSAPEWAKHLRPDWKRWFWKGERNAEVREITKEVEDLYEE